MAKKTSRGERQGVKGSDESEPIKVSPSTRTALKVYAAQHRLTMREVADEAILARVSR